MKHRDFSWLRLVSSLILLIYFTARNITAPAWASDFSGGCTAPLPTKFSGIQFPMFGANILSSRAVTLRFTQLEIVANLEPYLLDSTDDEQYRLPVSAMKSGFDRQAKSINSDNEITSETRLHLLFPYAMKESRHYRLIIPNAKNRKAIVLSFVYLNCHVTDSIQVSQAGYLPQGRQYAYAGNWLGNAGAMPVDDIRFHIINANNGLNVRSGTLVLRVNNDPLSGNNVYEADLTGLTTGSYRLYIPELGASHIFRVDDTIAEKLYRQGMSVVYMARNSTPIVAPWAIPGFERPDGGVPSLMNGVFHPILTSPLYPLHHSEAPEHYHAVTKGWFDAGDYGQYISNWALVYWAASLAIDIAPQRFRDHELNIPENANGIPDLLDEISWGMEWGLSMQDDDGGVYNRIASETWDSTLPENINKPRYIYEKTSHATASFAAAAAIYSRLIKPYDVERAKRALVAAESAWLFLQTHQEWPPEGERYRNPPHTHAGEYADTSCKDNLLWAAAELYRSTGIDTYHQYFTKHLADIKPDTANLPKFDHVELPALWAYLMSGINDTAAQNARKFLLTGAHWRLRQAELNDYRVPMHPYIGFVGWGSFGQSARNVLPLLQGYVLSHDKAYLLAAQTSIYAELGANPQGISYITGTGNMSALNPLSKLSLYSGQSHPMPGIPVNGPQYHLPGSIPAHNQINEVYFPPEQPNSKDDWQSGYPALRRYIDTHLAPPMSEPTIVEEIEVALGFALLAKPENIHFQPIVTAPAQQLD